MSFSSSNSPRISVEFSLNQGAGTRTTESVTAGTTLGAFLSTKNVYDSSRYSWTLNRREVDDPETEILQDGDRISVVPEKVAGAVH